MPFKKGKPKTGGKEKGSLNKATRDIKEAYRMLIEKNLDNLTTWLEIIAEKDPDKAIRIINDLSEYVIPKLARTDLTTGDKPIKQSINVTVDSSKTGDMLQKLRNGT